MDNEGGLTTIDTPIAGPTATMGTDMDLAMAYKQLADSCPQHQVERIWVMGHADVKKKDEPEAITPLEHVNIDCDLDAGECMELQEAPQPFKGLPGYKAMLKLGGQWVTTHFRENVGFASTASPIIQYAIKRLKITEDIFHTINWYIVGRVRASHRIHRVLSRCYTDGCRSVPTGNSATLIQTGVHVAACKMKLSNTSWLAHTQT